MKRSSTTKNSSQPQDPREELSQVAGLVEKRRIQNRISQRNYRNKIRDRLEALEALVDQKTKDEAADNSRPVSPGTARSSTTVDTSSKRAKVVAQVSAPTTPQEDPTNQWDPVNEFLDASTADLDDIYDLAYQSFSSDHFPDPTSPSLFTTGPESMPRNLPDPALTIGLSPSNTIDIPEPQNPKSGDDATSSLDPVAPPPGLFTGSPSSHQPPPHAHRQTYNAFSFAYPVPLAMPISPMSTMFYQGNSRN
ncbi:MAG: hypothetical protein LQ341_003858 [Variospora aurantia]|nr:MAG: hypothetical protein LQ341_003858 [Variospora aurantia]